MRAKYNKWSVKFDKYGLKWSFNTPYFLRAVWESIVHGFAKIKRLDRYGFEKGNH